MITEPVPVSPQDAPKPRRPRQSARSLSREPVLDLVELRQQREPEPVTPVLFAFSFQSPSTSVHAPISLAGSQSVRTRAPLAISRHRKDDRQPRSGTRTAYRP